MKSKIMRLFLLLSLVAGIGATATQAASRLNIPFDFTVNGKLMKAGNYELKFGISSSTSGAFLLRSMDGKDAVIVSNGLSKAATPQIENTTAIFEKSENGYRLAEIQSSRTGVELSKNNQSFGKIVRIEIHSSN